MRKPMLVLTLLALASPALAQGSYRHGRIRLVEGGTTLQRADDSGAEEALRNLPFLPGDRVWTDETGRAEFQFGAAVVRLDSRSKLDYLAHEEQEADRVVLRLWSGSVFVELRDDQTAPDLEIETPAGVVQSRGRGVFRVDLTWGEARLSVYDGEAVFDDGRGRLTAEASERIVARRGEEPEGPSRFDRGEADQFARWNTELDEDEARVADSERYLPEEIAPYASELDRNGSWHFQVNVGYVWTPYVSPGWRPYWNGRWAWTPDGWSWVPGEVWGWAPSHYGRWDYGPTLGWYWIPGRTWRGAWVEWSLGGDYVGWCPLGWRDRPVAVLGRRGYAVPRGSIGSGDSAWTFVRRGDLLARDVASRRVVPPESQRAVLRYVDPNRDRIDRSLHVVERGAGDARSAPRGVALRPTPGDTIQELRSDPATTIPFPVPRRHYPSEEERRRQREHGAEQRSPIRYDDAGAGQAGASERTSAAPASGRVAPPTSLGAGDAPRRPMPWPEQPNAGREQDAARARQRSGSDAGREVLRRMFAPLSEGRGRDSGASSARPRDSGEATRARSPRTPQASPSPHGESRQRSQSRAQSVRRKPEKH
jgi:Family of unknown function (DUF6600)